MLEKLNKPIAREVQGNYDEDIHHDDYGGKKGKLSKAREINYDEV